MILKEITITEMILSLIIAVSIISLIKKIIKIRYKKRIKRYHGIK